MLCSFQIDGFKSYRSAKLDMGGTGNAPGRQSPLTVLVGANASGKTNLIEGLRLLSTIASGVRLDTIRPGRTDADIRGSLGGLGYRDGNRFTFSCTTDYDEYRNYGISVELRDGDGLHIVDERIHDPGRNVPLFEVFEPSAGLNSDIEVAYDNFARGGRKPRLRCTDQVCVLSQLRSSARFPRTHRLSQQKVPEYAGLYQNLLQSVRLLDPRPRQMRGYSYQRDTSLDEHGTNLSAVLFNLCRDLSTKERILDFIRDVPEQNIVDIAFIETERGDVMLKLRESFGARMDYDASELSDGTLRILAVAAAVLSTPKDGIVIVEEIDNGVHPSRVEGLLANLSQVAAERNLSVLLTTHNPALLDALPIELVASVVFCYRDPKEGDSRLIRLDEVPDFPKLTMQGPLGRLLTHRTLDRFVKNVGSSEEQKRRALDWVQTLRESQS